MLVAASLGAAPPPRAEGPSPALVGELSSQGTDRGALELGLGSVAVGVTAALIAHGIYQIFEGQRKEEICRGFASDPPECAFDGPNLRYAGAGLSFAFAVPVAVGAGLFLRKGVRINRDYKAYRALEGATQDSEQEARWVPRVWVAGATARARRGDRGPGGMRVGVRLRMRF